MLLRVNKIKPENAYRGVVRIGRDVMQMLNVKPKDAVRITGRSGAAARI
jgi:antitoxin component of MazEF toxin-antitoxin module